MFHIRYEGRSFEIKPKIFELTSRASDREILNRVSEWLGVPQSGLSHYVVDRRPGGDVVVRPEAVYG